MGEEPNAEAIRWYVEEAQRLLEDQQRRAESLKSRGGQVGGFAAAVLALIAGNAATVLGAAEGSARVVIGIALLAAMVGLAFAVALAIWSVMRPQAFVSMAADEITAFTSKRFLHEADLWRVHLRALRTLEQSTRRAQEAGNATAEAIMHSLYAFLAGLAFSLVSLGTLIFELI